MISRINHVQITIPVDDIKSKNVLLKHDLTACIGDFGLALIMKPNEKVSDKQVQVRLHIILLSTSTPFPPHELPPTHPVIPNSVHRCEPR